MNNLKRTLSVLLAVMMMLVMSVLAFAASSDTGFSDVALGMQMQYNMYEIMV